MKSIILNFAIQMISQHIKHCTHWNLTNKSIKTTSIENVSTEVLEKNKEHYSRSKDKADKIILCIKPYTIAYVKIKKN